MGVQPRTARIGRGTDVNATLLVEPPRGIGPAAIAAAVAAAIEDDDEGSVPRRDKEDFFGSLSAAAAATSDAWCLPLADDNAVEADDPPFRASEILTCRTSNGDTLESKYPRHTERVRMSVHLVAGSLSDRCHNATNKIFWEAILCECSVWRGMFRQ